MLVVNTIEIALVEFSCMEVAMNFIGRGYENGVTMHFSINPLTRISAILVFIGSFAVELVIFEVSLVAVTNCD